MHHFAERGIHAARVEDIAAEIGIAKGSIFQHFETKDGLFLAAYRASASMLPAYMDSSPHLTTGSSGNELMVRKRSEPDPLPLTPGGPCRDS